MKNILLTILAVILIVNLWGCQKDNADGNPPDRNDTLNPPQTPAEKVLRSDLNFPWEILWGKDNHIWMTERQGKISKINPANGNTVFSHTISDVVSRGEGGLLGMVQDPKFLENGFLYVVYNYEKSGNYIEKVVRLTYQSDQLRDPLVLIDNIPAANIHNGSRLWITDDASPDLYITTGDAAVPANAQQINSLSGKILRIKADGSIPADNPFSSGPVWSIGHRNPQGMVMVNNKLYSTEHGPSIEDELNRVEKGANFGWPEVNGPCNGGEQTFCSANNVLPPLWSTGSSTFALSGMDYYNFERIPSWKKSLLITSLKNATLYVVPLNDDGNSTGAVQSFFNGKYGRLRDVCVSPQGSVYLCTSNGGGSDRLIEINKAP
jgi:glucose/arabinose dehydrogenase